PDVHAALERGCRVADIGCGGGVALEAMARRFPNSQFHGYDPSTHAIARARDRLAEVENAWADVGRAEDLAQDALLAALEQWPRDGVPANPGAWLTAVARRRWIDQVRRDVVHDRTLVEVGRGQAEADDPIDAAEFDEHVDDDVLRLIFTACHPVLPREARTALTLRLVGGLTTEQIARAFLVQTTAMAARITRAKKTLADAKVPFEVPVGTELAGRLASVLEVVYLIFNEGYSATAGEALVRRELCDEAMRLGRMLAALAPHEPEAHALVALMEIQASRLPTRTAPDGTVVTLLDQDRSRWDRLLITHGLAALARAEALVPAEAAGSYLLQAQVAACHARAARADDTDWARIAAIYGVLAERTGSPVVELNRAVAVSMADGAAAALPIVDALAARPELRRYHLLPSVRGDLLSRLGRTDEARAEFERAAAMTANERERAHLLARAANG
ncbi:MAG: DUF6596 domain-containing protein, partial [Jatrophihabitans sp.]|uniref:DUF6596 domain-containing protein n=1 Tax=Jatrophihabitans sp. TaxID=1932789 RepID=UPI003F7DA4AA